MVERYPLLDDSQSSERDALASIVSGNRLLTWLTKSKSHKIILAAVIVAIVTVSSAAFYYYSFENMFGVQLGGCSEGKQLLSVSPIGLGNLSTVVPLGNFGPSGGHVVALQSSHIYLNYVHESSNASIPVPVSIYAPADLTVYQIFAFNQSNGGNTPTYTDYKVSFAVCDQVGGYFIHVMNLSSTLKSAFDNASFSSPGTKSISVKLKAGQVIGTAGGNPDWPANLDFGMVDSRVPAGTVANPARYSSYDLHYVCPMDYFPSNVGGALYSRLGDFAGQLLNITSPKCGNPYQDVGGTAQGVWLQKTIVTSNNEPIWNAANGQLDFGYSNLNHSMQVVSISSALGQQLGITVGIYPYEFVPQPNGSGNMMNLNFTSIYPGSGVYCFQASIPSAQPTQQIAVIAQLMDSTTLRLGVFNSTSCGNGPWQFSSYVDFVR
jgi:hypothetical protein